MCDLVTDYHKVFTIIYIAHLIPGFLNFSRGTSNIWDWVLPCRSCLLHYGTVASTFGLHSLVTLTPICDNNKCLRALPNIHQGTELLPLWTTVQHGQDVFPWISKMFKMFLNWLFNKIFFFLHANGLRLLHIFALFFQEGYCKKII